MYKKIAFLPLLLGSFSLLAATAVLAKTSPPNYSAFAQQSQETLRPVSAILSAQKSNLVDHSHALHVENALGVPTFLWAQHSGQASASAVAKNATTIESSARSHLSRYASLYRLNNAGLQSAKLQHIHKTDGNVVIAQFSQQVDGVEVFGHKISLLMDKNLNLSAISGYLSPHASATAQTAQSAITNVP